MRVSEGTQKRRREEREGEGGAVIGAEWPVERSYPQVLPATACWCSHHSMQKATSLYQWTVSAPVLMVVKK